MDETGEATAFLLHALLLQRESLGLVESCDGCWRVAALGYASVRDLLDEHQYLTDPF